jgi:hypothetical protein
VSACPKQSSVQVPLCVLAASQLRAAVVWSDVALLSFLLCVFRVQFPPVERLLVSAHEHSQIHPDVLLPFRVPEFAFPHAVCMIGEDLSKRTPYFAAGCRFCCCRWAGGPFSPFVNTLSRGAVEGVQPHAGVHGSEHVLSQLVNYASLDDGCA